MLISHGTDKSPDICCTRVCICTCGNVTLGWRHYITVRAPTFTPICWLDMCVKWHRSTGATNSLGIRVLLFAAGANLPSTCTVTWMKMSDMNIPGKDVVTHLCCGHSEICERRCYSTHKHDNVQYICYFCDVAWKGSSSCFNDEFALNTSRKRLENPVLAFGHFYWLVLLEVEGFLFLQPPIQPQTDFRLYGCQQNRVSVFWYNNKNVRMKSIVNAITQTKGSYVNRC